MEKMLEFLSENFQFLVVKFSIYLHRRVFVMCWVCLVVLWQKELVRSCLFFHLFVYNPFPRIIFPSNISSVKVTTASRILKFITLVGYVLLYCEKEYWPALAYNVCFYLFTFIYQYFILFNQNSSRIE